MTRHDPMIRVKHMRDHAREAIELLGNKTVAELQSERVLQLALVQLIEIVGEAAAQVSDEIRKAHPSIPWQIAADMRNRLIHGYDVIEFSIVYDTVTDDLPPLVQQLNAIIRD
jgi:uncharacterized protein with HEPN domain